MRRPAAISLVLLAVLLALRPVSAQPIVSVQVAGQVVRVSVSYEGSFSVSVVLRDALGSVAGNESSSCSANCSVTLPRPRPGVYYVDVVVSQGGSKWRSVEKVVVEPSKSDFAALLARLSRVAASVRESPYLYGDLRPLVSEAETYYRMALDAFLEGRLEDAAYYYMRCRGAVVYLEGELERRGGGAPYSVFSHLEEYLSLSLPVVVDFWSKVLLSTFLLPLLLVAVAPLYISSVEDWIQAVITGLGGKDESLYTAIEETRRRALELLQGASGLVKVKFKTLVMTLISALIAAIGLITNNTAVVIASMLIAPFMSVVLGAAIGLAMPRREVVADGEKIRGEDLFSAGLRNIVFLTFASLLLVWVTVKVASFYVPIIPGSEIMARSRPNFSDLAIAIGAGLACAVSYVGILEFSGLIGAAIAIALIPPLATVGIGIAIGRFDIALGAASLFYINTISIILASIFVIKLYIVYPVIRFFYSNLEKSVDSPVEFIVESLGLWFNATFGFRGGWDEESAARNLRRLLMLFAKFILFPLSVVAGYALLMSSPIPPLLSQASVRLVEYAGAVFSSLPLRINEAIVLVAFLVMARYTVKVVRGCKACRRGFIVSAAFFWLILSLTTKISYFPRSNLVFLTIFAVYVVAVYHWERIKKRWSHYVILGFTVFTILVISLQSIEIYQASMVAQKLGREGRVVADSVAIFFGIDPGNVTTKVVQDKNPKLLVRVYVSVRDLKNLERLSGALEILEEALRSYGFGKEQVEIVFTLKP